VKRQGKKLEQAQSPLVERVQTEAHWLVSGGGLRQIGLEAQVPPWKYSSEVPVLLNELIGMMNSVDIRGDQQVEKQIGRQ
jgi:hypothetical protein